MAAWIDGRPVTRKDAAREAARLLATARQPVIAGLGADIAGVRAVLDLAGRVGAAVDHMHADALLRDVDVMREAGMMVTTPSEARLRADVLLLAGHSLAEAPDMRARRLDPACPAKRIVWLCPPRKLDPGLVPLHSVGRDTGELPALLAVLRARLNGHPVATAARTIKAIDAMVTELKSARFGVAVWSAGELDALAIEMLCTLVGDLNAGTRFTGLPLPPGDNGRGVLEACGWLSGYPMRTGFGRGYPEHDPWRFDASRLAGSRESDCAVWISAYGAEAPAWTRDLPTIALTTPGARFRTPPRVQVEVGTPGIDHDAVQFVPASGTLMPITAARPSEAESVASVIADILAALPESSSC
ncbi:tungsten formylmethanofuran dehydrogenase [Xanthobacteraceae bacterium Astr-EGSB]|uniref:tungsten formylmethanofuran dehydrogenase n=1 Tax=Astrobacterium formosum TaxID=3069710 RepID=UPI0027B4BEFE|nr:tungsten formylmethanofuran dehydrogenase [Xanthobacteraceae bacterium Astr-EGSB]